MFESRAAHRLDRQDPNLPGRVRPSRASGFLAWLAIAGAVLVSALGAALFAGTAPVPAPLVPVTDPSPAAPGLRAELPRQEPYRLDRAGVGRPEAAELARMLPARVASIVDGDTLKLLIEDPPAWVEAKETVRLIGVDTPETKAPGKPVEPGGPEATAFAQAGLGGKAVFLAFDRELRDRYGRLLAYVFFGDGRCFNALILAAGVGKYYPDYPFALSAAFARIEAEARRAGKGIWKWKE